MCHVCKHEGKRVVREILTAFQLVISIYYVILILRVAMSWMRLDPNSNVLTRFLVAVAEPLLAPIRSILPQNSMLDLSPIVACILLFALERALSILAGG